MSARTLLRAASAVLCLMIGGTAGVSAQSIGDHLSHYEVGIGYYRLGVEEFATFDGETIPNRLIRTTLNSLYLSLGWNIPVVRLGDRMSIGVNATGILIFGPTGSESGAATGPPSLYGETEGGSMLYGVEAPLLVSFKYGADATFRPKIPIGFGVGVGYRPTFLFASESGYNQIVAMAEAALVHENGVVKLRGVVPFGTAAPSDGVEISSFNVGLAFIW
jgi:hypothetical protein